MGSTSVNIDNFAKAETARMNDGIMHAAGGINQWLHIRKPTPLDQQIVIRMNRDTVYSSTVVDISQGATLILPDAGDRYISAMVVNEDHYIDRIFVKPGAHELTVEEFGTPFVNVSVRLYVDPEDPADIAEVNGLQDQLMIDARSSNAYSHPAYDPTSLDTTRSALLTLGAGISDARRQFGSADHVETLRHLIGTAGGWGGLPEYEAFYVMENEPRDVGHEQIVFKDVPVDAFWSISIYNRDGYFEENSFNAYSINKTTAVPNEDGSVTIDLAPTNEGYRNYVYVMDGWNYALRFYRPQQSILDGSWTAPAPQVVS